MIRLTVNPFDCYTIGTLVSKPGEALLLAYSYRADQMDWIGRVIRCPADFDEVADIGTDRFLRVVEQAVNDKGYDNPWIARTVLWRCTRFAAMNYLERELIPEQRRRAQVRDLDKIPAPEPEGEPLVTRFDELFDALESGLENDCKAVLRLVRSGVPVTRIPEYLPVSLRTVFRRIEEIRVRATTLPEL